MNILDMMTNNPPSEEELNFYYEGTIPESAIVHEVNNHKIYLVYSPFYGRMYGMPVISCVKDKETGREIVVAGAMFNFMTKTTQKVLTDHEIGHIINGDLDEDRDIEREFKADAYSASINGKKAVIDALKETLDLPFFIVSPQAVDEIKKRIKKLS